MGSSQAKETEETEAETLLRLSLMKGDEQVLYNDIPNTCRTLFLLASSTNHHLNVPLINIVECMKYTTVFRRVVMLSNTAAPSSFPEDTWAVISTAPPPVVVLSPWLAPTSMLLPSTLRRLCLKHASITQDDLIRVLQNITPGCLEHLDISHIVGGCMPENTEAFAVADVIVSQFPCLKYLDVSCTRLACDQLIEKYLPQLERGHLRYLGIGCRPFMKDGKIVDEMGWIDRKAARIITSSMLPSGQSCEQFPMLVELCPDLEGLDVSNACDGYVYAMDEAFIVLAKGLKKLRFLDARGCWRVEKSTFKHFPPTCHVVLPVW
eukprot:PhF_6_TR9231/c1_g1_i4/m.14541